MSVICIGESQSCLWLNALTSTFVQRSVKWHVWGQICWVSWVFLDVIDKANRCPKTKWPSNTHISTNPALLNSLHIGVLIKRMIFGPVGLNGFSRASPHRHPETLSQDYVLNHILTQTNTTDNVVIQREDLSMLHHHCASLVEKALFACFSTPGNSSPGVTFHTTTPP